MEFQPKQLTLDLATTDSPPKRYSAEVPLYGAIDAQKSSYKVLGTKLELNLTKAMVRRGRCCEATRRRRGRFCRLGVLAGRRSEAACS